MGVAGFRIDAAKHVWPDDLKAILSLTTDLNREWFPPATRAYVYHEVIDRNSHGAVHAKEYIAMGGRVTDFSFAEKVLFLGFIFSA